MRFDTKSLSVMAAAVVSSLFAAWGITHIDGAREARAETPMVVQAVAPAPASAAQVTRSPDGHYWAQADINGRAVKVLVDTGATVVALTRDDALRLGFRLTSEDFTRTVHAANGQGRAAPVELAHVAVAGARVEKVEALVVERGLPTSLLGMSYLGRLSRIEATPQGLTLRS